MTRWREPWWAQLGSLTVGCRCLDDNTDVPAWTRAADGTPVHQCGYPSEAWLRSQWQVLNIFLGGPQHNTLVETADLLRDPAYGQWITTYGWTPETLVGSLTGREARVWRYKEPEADG